MVKTIRTIVIIILGVVFASCRQPKELVYENVQNISVTQAGLQKTTVHIDVRLYNPNNYSLKLRKSAIDVFLNNKSVGLINIPGGTLIARLDTSSIPVVFEINPKDIFPNLLQAALNNSVDLKLTGYIRAGRHGLFVKVPVNYEGSQDIFGGLIK